MSEREFTSTSVLLEVSKLVGTFSGTRPHDFQKGLDPSLLSFFLRPICQCQNFKKINTSFKSRHPKRKKVKKDSEGQKFLKAVQKLKLFPTEIVRIFGSSPILAPIISIQASMTSLVMKISGCAHHF